jgi:hypothetical protein
MDYLMVRFVSAIQFTYGHQQPQEEVALAISLRHIQLLALIALLARLPLLILIQLQEEMEQEVVYAMETTNGQLSDPQELALPAAQFLALSY